MISKNRLNRFAHGLAAAVLAVGFTAACSDDPTVTPEVDSGVDAEVPCEGHLCPPTSATMTLPEGGVIRYELFHVGYDADGNKQEILGGWTFLFKGQDPATRMILGPAVEGAPGCFDQSAGNYFLSGNTTLNQAIVDTRTYYDLGASLTLTSENETAIEMPKQEGAQDPSTLLQHDVLYLTDLGPAQAAALERNVKYPVPTIAPVGDFPGLDLRGGFDAMLGADHTDPPAMYFPADFTFNTPTEEEYFAAPAALNGGLQVDASQDLTFNWTRAAEPPAGWVGQLQFTGFLDENQAFKYLCLSDSATEQVIPASLFTQPEMPQSGKLIHGAITHVAWAQHVSDAEEYRIDLLGVNCKFSWFTLNNLPAQ